MLYEFRSLFIFQASVKRWFRFYNRKESAYLFIISGKSRYSADLYEHVKRLKSWNYQILVTYCAQTNFERKYFSYFQLKIYESSLMKFYYISWKKFGINPKNDVFCVMGNSWLRRCYGNSLWSSLIGPCNYIVESVRILHKLDLFFMIYAGGLYNFCNVSFDDNLN